MDFPDNLLYTHTHEWVRKEGNKEVFVGITQHAQEQISDVVFVELPKIGATVGAGKACAVVESVKAAYDIYAPVSGKVVKVNDKLENSPQLANEDPYGQGWFFAIDMENPEELKDLLTSDGYSHILHKEA
ncbi:MAG: glycine cleavage system protein GcvH [Candidatus Brocadiales bacterium]